MQGVHEGTGATLLPALLAAAPPPPSLLYIYAIVLTSAQVQQHAPSALSCTPPPLPELHLFIYWCLGFFYCLVHAGTHLVLSEVAYLCSCVRVFSSPLCVNSGEFLSSFLVLSFFCLSLYVFTRDCTCGCLTPRVEQASRSYSFSYSPHVYSTFFL